MRTIKFRGKTHGNGKWYYGSLVYSDEINAAIYFQIGRGLVKRMDWVYVIPETIGQFTGLYDYDGKEIYEGDVLRLGNSPSGVCEVKWNESLATFCIRFFGDVEIGSLPLGEWVICERKVKVIGNIFDNPELLKGGEQ